MATQIIPGALRETNNPLLLKAEIGKPLKRGFMLPPDQFTYGKTSQGEIFGAGDTISWHAKLKPLNLKEKKPSRDFISMNKAATRAGLVTAQEHFQYRATNEADPFKSNRIVKCKSGKDVPNDVVYGVPTKPSTPVFDLLEHKYQDQWLEEMQTCDKSKKNHKEKQKNQVPQKSYGETRASRLRRYSPPVDPPPLWQMSRFQKNALPALQTFRNEDVRRKAFIHHSSDCTARTGVFGQGNYESAKS